LRRSAGKVMGLAIVALKVPAASTRCLTKHARQAQE
jgi:hypothetical protein